MLLLSQYIYLDSKLLMMHFFALRHVSNLTPTVYISGAVSSLASIVFNLAGLGQKVHESMNHVDMPKWPINQYILVQQSRQQALRAYCSNAYTVLKPLFSTTMFRFRVLPILRNSNFYLINTAVSIQNVKNSILLVLGKYIS